MIELVQLCKNYGDVSAVSRMSLRIEKGELFGLLGPNGAGKTTLIKLMTGLLQPDSGNLEIDGLNPARQTMDFRRMIGLVPQELSFYGELSARENISYFAGLYGLKKQEKKDAVDRALEFTGLQGNEKKQAKSFSGGMKRRLNIACGIVHSPRVLFLDEPTVGIDPQSRHHILKSVEQLRHDGCTIVYTTHYMEEAESICSRIAILDQGKIIAQGDKKELQQLVRDYSCLKIRLDRHEKLDSEALLKIPGVESAEIHNGILHVNSEIAIHNVNQICLELNRQDLIILDIQNDAPNLENVFLKLTGRNLRD